MLDQSLWRAAPLPRFADTPLPSAVDVVVIGGGITGLTAAYLLKRAGKRVALFARERIGGGETGSTSAHLTYVTDALLADLRSRFGADGARLAWQAGATAIDLIESNVAERRIDCGFGRVPGFLCAPFFDDDDPAATRKTLLDDAGLAGQYGFAAQFVEHGPLTGRPAIAFADQAVFHPLRYLAGLAQAIDGDGCFVRENCEVEEIVDQPLAVVVRGQRITCADVVVATHVPMVGKWNVASATLFQTKLYPYSTYVLGARLPDSAPPPGLYNDTDDPYYYLRVHEDDVGRYGIFGGHDHKTGQETDTEERYAALTDDLRRLLPAAVIERRWSGQVIETDDGLPFIGTVAPHQHIATGYAGNGLTFGTIAGLMMHDAIVGAANPWTALFDPHRKASSVDAISRLVAENVDYPLHFIADRLRTIGKSSVEDVPVGGGKVVRLGGKSVAVHRRDDGALVKVDAVCTHMGCLVRWNGAERTWDCPCHGSRFTPEGLVIGGPAETPLAPVDD